MYIALRAVDHEVDGELVRETAVSVLRGNRVRRYVVNADGPAIRAMYRYLQPLIREGQVTRQVDHDSGLVAYHN